MDEENKVEEVANGQPQESKGLSVASMILGIVSVVLFCFWYLSIPCAILAIIFGVMGKKKGGKGMAKAGLILGIIAIVLVILVIVGLAAFITSFSGELSSLNTL